MNNEKEEKIKYFIFSSQQMKNKIEVESKIGRKYKPGTVLVRGGYKQFTDILDTPTSIRYPDAIVVASGYLSKMRYSLNR